MPKRATMKQLNDKDNPKSFGGKLLSDDGTNQLWEFNGKFANRTEYEEDGEWFYVWDDALSEWDPDDYGITAIK